MQYSIIMDDAVTDSIWRQSTAEFADYNLYQTLAYQDVRTADNTQRISRFVIRNSSGKAGMMGLIRIRSVVGLGLRIGYIQWGPLCRRADGIVNDAAALLDVLRNAYVPTIVNVLRISPNVFEQESGDLCEVLGAAGFEKLTHVRTYHTMLFPLDMDEEQILARFHKGWRRYLRKAQKVEGLSVQQGGQSEYMTTLGTLYKQALCRKNFEGLSFNVFDRTQAKLDANEKINVVVCDYEGQPVTAHSTSHLGDTALGLIAGSSEAALKVNATYLVWWHTLLAGKAAGMRRYDLAGVDPENNPKVYEFKCRMGAEEAWHIGTYECYSCKPVKWLWRLVEQAYKMIKGR